MSGKLIKATPIPVPLPKQDLSDDPNGYYKKQFQEWLNFRRLYSTYSAVYRTIYICHTKEDVLNLFGSPTRPTFSDLKWYINWIERHGPFFTEG
jgi:hypothetical protein